MNTITFNSFNQLKKFAAGKQWYVRLSNEYHIPTSKKNLKLVANRMLNNGSVFKGEFEPSGINSVQILIY